MQINSTPIQARLRFSPRTLCLALLASGLACGWQIAHAQAASAPAGKEESAPSERSKREAENVFRWIMIHSDKPRKVRDGKDDVKPPAPAPVANAPKPAPAARVAKAGEGSAEGAVVAPAAVPAVVSNPAPAPVARITPVPAATQAAQAIQPAPQPVPVSNVDNEAARLANTAAAHARGGAAAMPDAAAPPALAAAPEPDADEPLVMVAQVEPQFPRAVMLDLRKGTVRVRFDVMTNGSVSAPAVVSSTNVRLNRAALAAVAQWRFQPLREPQEGVVELGFNLD